MKKDTLGDLAFFGGPRAFESVRSTSNLVQPDSDKVIRYIRTAYEQRRLTDNGLLVQTLEKRLAEIHETAHCITTCSGFIALMICMRVLALKGRREVIMPSLTYRRLADVAAWAGLTPCFCNVDVTSLGMTRDTVEPCISGETALIVGVHPITNLCDIDGLEQVSSAHSIPLLFDSVEAAWATHKGKMIGSFGHAEVFSLHASKLLNGFEGGYVMTNDGDLADALRAMSRYGYLGEDSSAEMGLNAKLNEMHAAMTLACLDDLDNQIERNRQRHLRYHQFLSPIRGLDVIPYDEIEKRGYKNVLVRLNASWPLTRDLTLQVLHAENMLARPYYFPALHTKATTYTTHRCGDLRTTEWLSRCYILLPCGDFVSEDDIRVVADLLDFLQHRGREINDRAAQESDL